MKQEFTIKIKRYSPYELLKPVAVTGRVGPKGEPLICGNHKDTGEFCDVIVSQTVYDHLKRWGVLPPQQQTKTTKEEKFQGGLTDFK